MTQTYDFQSVYAISRDNVEGIVTRQRARRQRKRSSIPGKYWLFSSPERPDQLHSRPSLLFND